MITLLFRRHASFGVQNVLKNDTGTEVRDKHVFSGSIANNWVSIPPGHECLAIFNQTIFVHPQRCDCVAPVRGEKKVGQVSRPKYKACYRQSGGSLFPQYPCSGVDFIRQHAVRLRSDHRIEMLCIGADGHRHNSTAVFDVTRRRQRTRYFIRRYVLISPSVAAES